ncbi:MAG: hypothetical protein AAGB11_03550 [Pseudomonadota bacterium]
MIANTRLHEHVAAGEPVLIAASVRDPPRGVTLFAWSTRVLQQDEGASGDDWDSFGLFSYVRAFSGSSVGGFLRARWVQHGVLIFKINLTFMQSPILLKEEF